MWCVRARVYDMTSCELILATVIPLAAMSRENSNEALRELDPDMRGSRDEGWRMRDKEEDRMVRGGSEMPKDGTKVGNMRGWRGTDSILKEEREGGGRQTEDGSLDD